VLKILERLRGRLLDRRHKQKPVQTDRRTPRNRIRETDERLHHAVEDLEQTLSIHTDKFWKRSANDVQQEVQFVTFRSICTYSVEAGVHRLCRHPKHEAANTGIATCDEQLCPIIKGAA